MNENQMFDRADSFLDLVIIGAGGYLMYCALVMKISGKVPSTLVSRNVDPENSPHKDEYIKSMFLPTLLMGLIMVLCGISAYLLPAVGIILPANSGIITSLISMAIVVIYGIYTMNMQKKYLKD